MKNDPTTATKHRDAFLYRHSLSIVSSAVLLTWVILYIPANPDTHWGSFFGNAIADWSGVVATVICTRILYERGNPDCQPRLIRDQNPVMRWLKTHTLTIFFGATLLMWIYAFARMNATSKWGQVVGNVVSEWTQILGVIWLTKRFIEGSSVRDRRRQNQEAANGEKHLPSNS